MSLLHHSPDFYSNENYYWPRTDALAVSQARQTASFVEELIRHHWLTRQEEVGSTLETVEYGSADVLTPVTTLKPRVKEHGDNLLRLTKTRSLQKLRSIA